MKKLLAILSIALISSSAFAATAFFTGQQEYVTTVTYRHAVRCQYNYSGQLFWRLFENGFCPGTIEVY